MTNFEYLKKQAIKENGENDWMYSNLFDCHKLAKSSGKFKDSGNHCPQKTTTGDIIQCGICKRIVDEWLDEEYNEEEKIDYEKVIAVIKRDEDKILEITKGDWSFGYDKEKDEIIECPIESKDCKKCLFLPKEKNTSCDYLKFKILLDNFHVF